MTLTYERVMLGDWVGVCIPTSGVESNPVRLTQTLQTLYGILIMAAHGNAYTLRELSQVQSDSDTIWHTYYGCTWECIHTGRVESSPTNIAKSRVLVLHVSFLSVGLQ